MSMTYEGSRIKKMIENFYDQWSEVWAPEIGEGQCKSVAKWREPRYSYNRRS